MLTRTTIFTISTIFTPVTAGLVAAWHYYRSGLIRQALNESLYAAALLLYYTLIFASVPVFIVAAGRFTLLWPPLTILGALLVFHPVVGLPAFLLFYFLPSLAATIGIHRRALKQSLHSSRPATAPWPTDIFAIAATLLMGVFLTLGVSFFTHVPYLTPLFCSLLLLFHACL